jgi:hypothetical protein
MTRRGCALALFLFGLLAGSALGNVAPTMEDQFVSTVQDTPVDFLLRASDEDIDPADPTAHPMRFVILDGPNHGVLLGDLTDVSYEGPHDAVVELTYVPADGYVGTDLLTVAVYDPFDETASGTTRIEIDVAARRMVGIWSGSWHTEVTAHTDEIASFRSQIREVFRIGQLTLQALGGVRVETVGGVKESTLDPLQFHGSFALGDFDFRSTLAFDPEKTSPEGFDYFRATAQYSLAGLGLICQLFLDDLQTRSYQTLTAYGLFEGVRFVGTTRFDMDETCDYAYTQTALNTWFDWCALDVRSIVLLTCDGFSYLSIGMYDYELPLAGFSSPSFQVLTDLVVRFETTAKTISPTLELKTRWIDCVRLLGEVTLGAATELDGFSVYGVVLQETLGGVTFRSATSFVAAKNASVTGQVDYFELVSLYGTTMSCCGVPGTWFLATYFQNDHPAILSWGMTKLAASVSIGTTSLSASVTTRTGGFGDPPLELTFAWLTRW